MYYNMAQEGADGWLLPLTEFHFTLVNNIKRDPFEAAIGSQVDTAAWAQGALAAPMTAYIYDWNILPIGQQLWYKELMSYKDFPPLQLAASYNLESIQEMVTRSQNRGD
jgi:arylsulfatase